MPSNELVANFPRIGWYIDGLPDDVTPPVTTMLVDDGTKITLTIPWQQEHPTGQVERWFYGDGIVIGDDPDRTRFAYEVPETLVFIDVDGPVALVRCRSGGYRSNLGAWSVGQGIVNVQLVVLGTCSLKYGRVNGIRTAIPELAEWMGATSISERSQLDEDGRMQQMDITLRAPEVIRLASKMNVRIVPGWQVKRQRYQPHQLDDEFYVETLAARPREWEDHLRVHQSLRELLDVAAWEPFGYKNILASRHDDPARAISGEVLEPRWCEVRTYALRSARTSDSRPNYWFYFADIGPTGFRRWLSVRATFERAVTPLLALLDARHADMETRLMQSSVGLEALGYQLAVEGGMSERIANRLTFENRLEIVRDCLRVKPVRADWPARAAGAYNGVKHVNRSMPDLQTMANVSRENILTFRMWVATRLGVKSNLLTDALSIDQASQVLRRQGLAP